MMRPSTQAVALASNNTDTMFAAIAPASPTLQAQQHRLATGSADFLPQQSQQSPATNSTVSHQNHQGRMVAAQNVGSGVAGASSVYESQHNLYGYPQLIGGHLRIHTPVYTSALQASSTT